MRFSIFTHAVHKIYKDELYSYAPYVKEMNLWNSHFEEICVLGPVSHEKPDAIDAPYIQNNIKLDPLPKLHFKNKKSFLKSFFNSITVIKKVFQEMKKADHIHIRCPGNIGLLACLTQILFPYKPKTIKYAGNWAPGSEQPKSYRLQKWLISNTFLTRNTKVLVYGEWQNQSANIIPFFTASYTQKEQIEIEKPFDSPFKFIFAGSLVEGKRPFFAIKLIENLKKKGFDVEMDIYGNGILRNELQEYVIRRNLKECIKLFGNQPSESLKEAYKFAHFSILPSKSEGWPKAIAEAMYFGCVPIATEISCLSWMLGEGERGILIKPEIESSVEKISHYLDNPKMLVAISKNAKDWSQKYTIEKFEQEIRKIL